MQHCAQLESCTVCPPFKLLRPTLRVTVAEVESSSTSATPRITVSACVHHLQHCMQLPNAMLHTVMHGVSVPLNHKSVVLTLEFQDEVLTNSIEQCTDLPINIPQVSFIGHPLMTVRNLLPSYVGTKQYARHTITWM